MDEGEEDDVISPPRKRIKLTNGSVDDDRGPSSVTKHSSAHDDEDGNDAEADPEVSSFGDDVGGDEGQLQGTTSEPQPPVDPALQMLPIVKYEYLDHTADVQIHAWGYNLQEAFEQCAMGMFAYMTDIETVDNFGSETIEAQGHDMLSLLYGFLDEFLFIFNADPNFIARKINITSFDRDNFKIKAVGYGETFDLRKHPQGTEVKAITYSNMQFHESEEEEYAEVFVIIDI